MGFFKQLFGGSRIFIPSEHLPTEGWCQAPGVMRMNLVWPWYAIENPEPLVDSFGRDVGVTPCVEARAPRSDRDAVLTVWSDPGGGLSVPASWVASVARMYQGPMEASGPIAIGGATGHLVRIANGADANWRIVVPRTQVTIQIEVSVPRAHAESYWVQVESMLATWGWDD